MLRVLRRKARAAANLVIKIFVPNCKEGARQQPEHSVIDDRPFRGVTVPHRKRTALEWYFLCRMICCVLHVHVPGLSRGINFVVELVRPCPDKLLQIVVAKLAVVETVGSSIDRVHLVRRSPLDHHCAGWLSPWIFLPNRDVGAVVYAGLNCPLIVNLRGGEDSFMTIVIEAVEDRMAGHEIVRSQLRLDVRFRNDSADANVHSLENVWYVEIKIDHRHINAGIAVVLSEL